MSHGLLFVYGSLREGQSNAGLLQGLGAYEGRATVQGTLYRVSEYPGMVARGSTEVAGELFRLSDPSVSLADLDEFEGAEYQRIETDAVTAVGSAVRVWVYEYRGPLGGLNVIESGDWVADSAHR